MALHITITTPPPGRSRRCPSDGSSRIATPDQSHRQPADRQQARHAAASCTASTRLIQIGTVAIITAAMPDGIRCSATETRPLPPSSSSCRRSLPCATRPDAAEGGADSVRGERRHQACWAAGRQPAGRRQPRSGRRRPERRQRLDHVRDRQVGRAPDDVHRAQRQRHGQRRGATAAGGHGLIVAETDVCAPTATSILGEHGSSSQ